MSNKSSKGTRKKNLKHLHKQIEKKVRLLKKERRRPDTRIEVNHVRSEPIAEEQNPTEVNISETGRQKCLQNQMQQENSRMLQETQEQDINES